ncbi:MAG TPA: NTP transferase domain-containing protein [Candidatus Angelobacter sp.]|nr:NTP transferase domain-containing protein [Candidatus Angelobacter sp.]
MSHLAAIVLGGGRSRRFGADKLDVDVRGAPLLRHSVDAALQAGASVVVVGPARAVVPEGVRVVREDPPYAGPYAAVAAGLGALGADADVVLVLAGDLVDPGPLLPRLLAVVEAGAEAAVAVDASGRRQPLLAAYRVAPLRGGVAGVDPMNRAAGELLDGLRVVEVPDTEGNARDIDVPADAAAEEGAGG